jgi:hypothetical protein
VKEVTQQPDPTVLPATKEVIAAAVIKVDDYAKLLWARQQPSGGNNS